MKDEGQWNLNHLMWEDIGYIEVNDLSITEDGKTLFFYDMKSFFRCNLDTGMKEELINFEEDDTIESLINFEPIEGTDHIFFVAFCDETDDKGQLLRTCGILDTKTKEISYLGKKNLMYGEIHLGEYVIVTPCDMEIEAGLVWLYNEKDGSFYEYKLKDSTEIMNLWISESGKYCIYLKNGKNSLWEIKIENMITGSEICTISHENAPNRILCFEEYNILYVRDFDSEKKAKILVKLSY